MDPRMARGTIAGRVRPAGPLEVASGLVLGPEPGAPDLPTVRSSSRAVFEAAVLPALSAQPCVVAFSGGRDSSAVLAVAADLARRHGLPLPVPITLRFPEHPATHESDHQELVVRHLGLPDWEIVELGGDDWDVLGPLARRTLLRHGLGDSPLSHGHVPVYERAAGGSVLTGYDGDAVLAAWRWQRLWYVARHPSRARFRDLGWLGLAISPRRARAWDVRLRASELAPWLTADARREVVGAFARARASEPVGWSDRIGWYAARRSLHLHLATQRSIAGDHGVQVFQPWVAPAFLSAVAREGGRSGLGGRTATMRRLFGDVLPAALLERRTKAEFRGPYITDTARSFMREWDGRGVDPALVDVDALVAHWNLDSPHPRSAWLAQQVWLADARDAPPGYEPPTMTELGYLQAITAGNGISAVDDSQFSPGDILEL